MNNHNSYIEKKTGNWFEKMVYFWYIWFVVLKIMGLAPMSLLKNPSRRFLFHTSFQNVICNITILSVYILIHLYCIFFQDLFKSEAEDMILILNDYFIIISFLITTLTVVVFTLKRQVVTDICNEFYEIIQVLQHFDELEHKKKANLIIKFLIASNFCCGCLVIIWCFLLYGTDLNLLFVVIDDYLVTWIVVQYVFIIVIMTVIIKTINDRFRSFYRNTEIATVSAKNWNVFIVQNYVVQGETENKFLKNKNEIDTEMSFLKLTKLKALQKIWITFMDTMVKLVDFYSLIVLGCGFKFFFSILADAYAAIKPALEEKRLIPRDFKNAFDVFYVLWDTALLLVMTSSVTGLTNEVNQSDWSKLIHIVIKYVSYRLGRRVSLFITWYAKKTMQTFKNRYLNF